MLLRRICNTDNVKIRNYILHNNVIMMFPNDNKYEFNIGEVTTDKMPKYVDKEGTELKPICKS